MYNKATNKNKKQIFIDFSIYIYLFICQVIILYVQEHKINKYKNQINFPK